MPAKAGIQNYLISLDSRLRGNDAKGVFKTFYETINVGRSMFDVHLLRKTGKAKMYPVNVYETTGTYGGKTLGIDGRG